METLPTHPENSSLTSRPAGLKAIFAGAGGIRSGWRFLIFVAICAAGILATNVAIAHIAYIAALRNQMLQGTMTPSGSTIQEAVFIFWILVAARVMASVEKRRVTDYWIPLGSASAKLFFQGAMFGLIQVLITMLLIKSLGGFSFGTLALGGWTLVRYAGEWAVAFTLVGFAEEFMFRGYPLYTLATGTGFWPAAVILGVVFGVLHLFNAGENWVGALDVVVFALVASFMLLRTGNLWFAIGFHAAGDYAETFIFSVRDSGIAATGQLLHSSFHGPAWLTGGSVGPEGSVFDLVSMAIVLIAFAFIYPTRKLDSHRREATVAA